VKLYRPVASEPVAYPQLPPALTRPIRWELIAQPYDQTIKYATAIRTRTTSTEAILRRFTRNGANSVITHSKDGEIASNRRDEQEMFVLCLRILQSVLVYVNTLMLRGILGEPEWARLLTPADRTA
jgi:TnpA family transposase